MGEKNMISPPSKIERLTGNVATDVTLITSAGAAASLVAGTLGGVLVPLIPVLMKSIAASRQQDRIDAALREITKILQAHERAIEQLTDPQFKLINEIVLAVLHTTENEKLAYLKRSLEKALYVADLGAHEAIVLSRMVRDISSAEAAFLLSTFAKSRVHVVDDVTGESQSGDLRVCRKSSEGLCAFGLVSLGLLTPTDDLYTGGMAFTFSPISAKLISLLQPPEN